MLQNCNIDELDVDPRRDDDASPMSSYGCMLRPTYMISALWHKSKFNIELKKKQVKLIFMFPCCGTLEDLSIDVSISITNVRVILTKLRWFQLFSHKSKFKFRTFLKKIHICGGFPCCSTREDLSIDVSITIVGLILTKLRCFQLFVTSQNSNFKLFWKKKFKFWGYHGVVLVKTFLLMHHLLM